MFNYGKDRKINECANNFYEKIRNIIFQWTDYSCEQKSLIYYLSHAFTVQKITQNTPMRKMQKSVTDKKTQNKN